MRIIITFTCFLIGYVSVFAQTLVCPVGLTNAGTELITNGNFSSGNSSFSSDYVNNQASTWNEGTYAITTNPTLTHPNFATIGDHTTGTGNMMVVNGSGTPNTNVWCQTFPVVPNTLYSFSCWVATIANPPVANLQFEVNGVALGVPFAAPSTSAQGWQQYANTWNSGSATTATICIINQNTATSGNDFAIDDISFQPCVCIPMNLVPTIQPATCLVSSDGSVNVAVSGGGGSFSYSWNVIPANSTNVLTGVPTGSYDFYVLDTGAPLASSCDTSVSYTVPVLPPIQLATAHTDATCQGGYTGTATVNASGGSGGYTYSWNTTPAQLTATATGLPAGTYTVTVRDNANSTACFETATVTIQDGPALNTSTFVIANTSCPAASDGSAYVVCISGSGFFTYSWNTTPIQMNDTASNLTGGTHDVVIIDTSDPLHCFTTASVTIQSNVFNPNLTTSVVKPVTCPAANDGSVTVQVAGGGSGYTYSWVTTPPQLTQIATNLSAGNYTVYVGNSGISPLCLKSANVTLNTLPPLTATTTLLNDAKCYGSSDGKVKVQVTGGSGSYLYNWNSTPTQTTANASNLPAGTYNVTITDAASALCTTMASVTVAQLSAVQASASLIQDASCFGSKDGSATSNAIGGTPPYTYKWSPSGQSTAIAINLGMGTYTVTAKDAHNCTATASVTIAQPTPLQIDLIEKHNAYCDLPNGDMTVIASNGNPPYTYSWATNPPQLSAQVTNLPASSVKVWAFDSKNCSIGKNFSITNTPKPIAAFSTKPINTETVYLSQATFLMVNESQKAMTYSWSMGDGATYTFKNPKHVYQDAGDYTILLIADNGYNTCPDSFSLKVHIIPDGVLFIPTAFTPNGDGINDEFKIAGDGVESFKLTIFDRWGKELITLTDFSQTWNGIARGQDVPEGAYPYHVDYKLNNGMQRKGSGSITIIR